MVPLDDRITTLRREVKLLLEPDEAEALARRLAGLAAPHESAVVAVYFDSPAGVLARRAAATPRDCVKVRAKSYHPQRGGPAGRIVFEVKRERGALSSKERIWVAPDEVRTALVAAVGVPGELAPIVATSYLRRTYQPSPSWRVTLDRGLAYHEVGWGLFADGALTWHTALCAPFGTEARVVVELKHGRSPPPAWIGRLAATRGRPFSKFLEAMARVEQNRLAGA